MPCYRCGARQTDPVRGPSPWKRGVREGALVLICPDCQREHEWAEDMDRCPSCGSTSLTRALGQTTCKSCGAVVAGDESETGAVHESAPGLSDDVSAALERTFRRR
jgi:ribosomal protein L37AE/L43A